FSKVVLPPLVRMQFKMQAEHQAAERALRWLNILPGEGYTDLSEYQSYVRDAIRDLPKAWRNEVMAAARTATTANAMTLPTIITKARRKAAQQLADATLKRLRQDIGKISDPAERVEAEQLVVRFVDKPAKLKDDPRLTQIAQLSENRPTTAEEAL